MKMKSVVSLVFALSLICAGRVYSGQVPGETEPLDRSHWDRAVETAMNSRCWMPAGIDTLEKVWDDRDVLKEESKTRLKVDVQNGQHPDLAVVSHVKNGKDRTSEFTRAFKDVKEGILEDLRDGNLFLSPEIKGAVLTGLALNESIAEYTFILTIEGLTFNGKARINTLIRHMISSELTCDRIEDDDHILRNFREVTLYGSGPDAWYPEKVIENLDIEIKGFFFSFKGRVVTETELLDYTCVDDK